ncbi:SIR2 family NAD-dependent protein deacylase [Deminuibacter soli]|uniref:Uncharacterized protein n=1 Tax=Deminuibacter soli TaxID=2291815 RepID=A0A3E1NHV6_9BACT|nr:SIR2 family protein [Deminuibacter soli]RFM27431.1 hypothetical protein DXN05_15540 [Deminuibacter soli]
MSFPFDTTLIPDASAEIAPSDYNFIQTIAANIKRGRCILFLGAGVNYCSDENEKLYKREQRPPTGWELAQLIKAELVHRDMLKDTANLSEIAQYHELEQGSFDSLTDLLTKEIKTGKSPSPLLYYLASMPFQYVMTTNYDQLFETALRAVKKEPYVGVYNRQRDKLTFDVPPNQITTEKPFVYKVHGDIDSRSSIVITDEDYIQFILRMSDKENYNPIPQSFTDALTSKSILFIGYRLMDYNLRLLFKTLRWGRDPITLPKNYSIDPAPNHLIQLLFEDNYKTHFIVLDAWKIIPLLYKEVTKE